MTNQGKMHPLLGRFDLDPGRWRPLYYGVKISVPVAAGGQGTGAIQIKHQPYILVRISHKIVGPTSDPNSGLVQDGQYDVEFSDELSNYQDGPIPADLMWGSWGDKISGFPVDIPYPIPFAGNKTLNFRVTNSITRTLASQEPNFIVAIALAGIADWGETNPGQR